MSPEVVPPEPPLGIAVPPVPIVDEVLPAAPPEAPAAPPDGGSTYEIVFPEQASKGDDTRRKHARRLREGNIICYLQFRSEVLARQELGGSLANESVGPVRRETDESRSDVGAAAVPDPALPPRQAPLA